VASGALGRGRPRGDAVGRHAEQWATDEPLAAAQIPRFKLPVDPTIIAGIALAVGGLLLIIATRWGHFG
jgi:hypothetical protein